MSLEHTGRCPTPNQGGPPRKKMVWDPGKGEGIPRVRLKEHALSFQDGSCVTSLENKPVPPEQRKLQEEYSKGNMKQKGWHFSQKTCG